MPKLLVLGGTGDSVKFVQKLNQIAPEVEVITSLAGRTKQPQNLVGETRIGGFGGVDGLAQYLVDQKIDCLIDITHPCAAQISQNAFLACQITGVPHLIFYRPAWEKEAPDRWIEITDLEQISEVIPPGTKRIFVTTGRQNLAPFVSLSNYWLLIRCVDPPDLIIPHSKVILDRGPFSLENELKLLTEYQIDTIVTKNSGGTATYAKILAARQLQLPVIMVQRPPLPPGEKVTNLEDAIEAVLYRLRIYKTSSLI
jgi:precorrin-6A/cobalt-precorrin-6A reductase